MHSKTWLLVFIILPAAIRAQQRTDSSGARVLDEVVVTAGKTEQKQSTTGKVITVIGRDQLEKSAGRSLASLLNEQVGVTVNNAYAPAGSVSTVFMRGADAGRTLVLLDGIPVNDPSQITGDFDLNLIQVNEVERIEICKGAQSTLYGSDAIAGVINIITTKKDIARAFDAKATFAAGNLGTVKGNAQVFGKIGGLTYNLRYAKLKTDGFSSAIDTSGKSGFDRDGYNGDVAHAAIQYKISPSLLVKSFIMFSTYRSDIDASAFTDDRYQTIHNDNLTAGAGFKYESGILALTGNYQYSRMHRRYLRDSTDKDVFSYYLRNRYNANSQFAELYAHVKIGAGFSLLAGSDYRFGSMNNDYFSVSAYGPFSSGFSDSSTQQTSFYGSLQYQAMKGRLNIEAGARQNLNSRFGNSFTYTFNPSFSINEHLRLFGSIARGYKVPSLYQLYDASSGNPKLESERSVNYEGGIQQISPKLSNRLVFFYRDVVSGIDFDYVNFVYFNFNRQTVRGLEYELQVRPTDALTITANYSYLSGSVSSQSRIDTKDTGYTYLLRRPVHSINLRAGYQFTPAVFASVGGKYLSRRYDLGGYQLPDVLLKEYVVLNAYAEWNVNAHVKLFADAQNLTGKKFYDQGGYSSQPFTILGGVTVQLGK